MRAGLRQEGRAVFGAALGVYLVVAMVLALHFRTLPGDAVARVANAYYVLFSRDPHLAAIGFVWNPLPSLLTLLLLPFKFVFPPLAEHALAGALVSAAAMAGAVYQLWAGLNDWGLSRQWRLGLTLGFAANPLVLEYAGNGMTEALFLFCLVATTRYLALWLDDGRLRGLAASAGFLAGAYLVRSEAVGAAVVAVGVVGAVSAARASGDRRQRLTAACADVAVFIVPFLAAFAAWAIASFVIVGHAFEQFASIYGNASILSAAGAASGGFDRASTAIGQLMGLSPLLAMGVALATYSVVSERDLRALAPVGVFGGVLAFAFTTAVFGATFQWLRYWIAAVPMTVLVAASVLGRRPRRWAPSIPYASPLAAVVVGASILGSLVTMASPSLASDERSQLPFVFHGRSAKAYRVEGRLQTARVIAKALDRKHLPTGSVLMDTFGDCASSIDLNSSRPRQFVITNDRDFQQVLADPLEARVRYLLAPARGGINNLDAINRAFPTLEVDGGRIAHLETQFVGAGCPRYSLYRVRLPARASP